MINLMASFIFPLLLNLGIGSSFNEQGLIDIKSPFTLIIFFNMTDCQVCLNEIESFNKIASKIDKSNLKVIGIVNSVSPNDITQFIKQNNINFNVLGKKDIFEKYDMSNEKTPFFIIVSNWKNNKIIYQSYAKKEASSQKATYDIVNMIVRNQN